MDPSQLRQLANDHAQGRVDTADYRVQRRTLIDGITSGRNAIFRQAPERVDAIDVESTSRRRRPWMLAVASLAIGVFVVLSLSNRPDPRNIDPATTPREVNAPRSTVTPARTLVESFLAKRNFSAEAIAAFEKAWDGLQPADHLKAQEQNWFATLSGAIDTEIRTQLALAELGSGGLPRQRAQRLQSFARHIGITLPEANSDSDDSANGHQQVEKIQSINAQQWLSIQPESNITLQLFAVDGLEHVARLMNSYRNLELHVLSSEQTPRYRVVHGSFPDTESAKLAFDALPQPIRDASNGAIVKSVSALREDLGAPLPTPSSGLSPPPADYTLQLFATGSEDSALALVRAYPDLNPRAVRVNDTLAPHRVLHGQYPDIDMARKGRDSLPGGLMDKVGRPLIKRIDTLQIQQNAAER